MIIQVLSMTPEQLAVLPPQDRANIMQLVSFGFSRRLDFDVSYRELLLDCSVQTVFL